MERGSEGARVTRRVCLGETGWERRPFMELRSGEEAQIARPIESVFGGVERTVEWILLSRVLGMSVLDEWRSTKSISSTSSPSNIRLFPSDRPVLPDPPPGVLDSISLSPTLGLDEFPTTTGRRKVACCASPTIIPSPSFQCAPGSSLFSSPSSSLDPSKKELKSSFPSPTPVLPSDVLSGLHHSSPVPCTTPNRPSVTNCEPLSVLAPKVSSSGVVLSTRFFRLFTAASDPSASISLGLANLSEFGSSTANERIAVSPF